MVLDGEVVSRPPYRTMYWSPAQMLAHTTVNGASVRTGDLWGSGTISGPERDQRGSLLELSWGGKEPFTAGGRERTFLEDGDEVALRYSAPGTSGGSHHARRGHRTDRAGSRGLSPRLGAVKQLGQYAAPRHAIAHLSDPHLIGGGRLHYGVVDNVANLRRALDRLAAVHPPPQALVFTGDLADQGEPEAYATLREVVEPAAEAMGAIVVWTMGNHDERAAYARGLYDSDHDGVQDRVHEVDGLRIVALDTSVPGYHHGALRPEQLAWLADVLATPGRARHPAGDAPPAAPAADAARRRADRAPRPASRSPTSIAGTDVRGILAGHLHFSTWSTFAGVPVSVASASCYTTDPAPVDRFVSGVDAAQAFTMVHTYDDRLVHTLVPLERGTEVNHVGLDIAEALETVSVEEARELASSKTSPFNS